MKSSTLSLLLAAATLAAAAVGAGSVRAADLQVKQDARQIGHTVSRDAKQVGHAARPA